MSKVDFYVLAESGEPSRQRFACRLAEKAYRLDNAVHIRVADAASASQLDDLLWTFRDGSFVPHEVVRAGDASRESPVTISHADLDIEADLLINLGDTIPPRANAYARIAEVVTADEPGRSRSREHFVAYRDQGHTLDTHKL